MNQKLEEYKKKSNKIIKTMKLIGIFIFLLGVLISIIQISLNNTKSNEEKQHAANQENDYVIDILNNTILYQNNFDINLTINNFVENSNYKIIIYIDNVINIEEENLISQNLFHIELEDEGEKNVKFIIYKDDEECFNKELVLYYVEPYVSQFLDDLSKKGICTHYRNGSESWEDYSKSGNLLKSLGVKYVRDDFLQSYVNKSGDQYNFSEYDVWVEDLFDNNIKILAITYGKNLGTDKLINSTEEVEQNETFIRKLIEHYPQIEDYEIFNELNLVSEYKGAYLDDGDIKWYNVLLNKLNNDFKEKNIIVAGTSTPRENDEKKITSENFYMNMYNTGGLKRIFDIAYHPYTYNNIPILKGRINSHTDLFNSFGGFTKLNVTEYGSTIEYVSEKIQAVDLVKQTITFEESSNLIILYNLWTTTTTGLEQFGILRNDYTPRPAYYSMKNFYQNTNGAEYIGTLNFQSNIEAHVYNKDGKPLIIAWSDNTNNTYDFPLNNLTAKDLYGKEILPDENGNIQITTSPVYLYNADYNTFYQAISNVATTKYDEFTEKFSEQISKVPGLQASIQKSKKSIQDISKNSTLSETTAINMMKEHYNLGTTILQAYKSGILQIEDVKVSSMLDMLDDIGGSFEDLVTVSAKTRNSNLTETRNLIATAEKLIKDNEDLEIIYPTKILNFSQDFYDKASYINSLEEENDIKTGLIVSKNLHSLLLANWANEFAKIYIDKYISNISVEIEYSNTEPTNKEVTATLKTDAAITVTNNQNSKTYKFTENGEFTFEYTIRGQAFTKKATVTNIDKTPPAITGVENEGFYTGSVTPKVTDTNLKEVKLYKNSTLVQNYASNSPIAQDGNYKIVATDKAGNQTTVTFYICKIPATISYSETNLTNKNVTATINSNYDLQVTNNSGKKTYTFTNNGTFTFNYKIKGKAFTVTATVNNIDKKAPVITGVEEGKLYIDQAVIPKVTDENLKEVNLYLNSVQVSNFSSGTQVTKEGFYKIVATDKAGNQTTINFSLMKNYSKEYKVKGKYIINITSNTKKTDFVKNFNNTSQYQVTRNGKALTNNDIIATGDILKSNNGDEYTLIVTGDINKDGDVDVVDIVKLRRYLLVRNNLDEAALLAADCNLDGESLSVIDLVKLRLIVLYKGAT